jgi:hypothetical protein
MFFVCLAHFGQGYLLTTGATRMGTILLTVGMLASPTFMLVSGAMLGFLRTTRPAGFAAFRAKLVDRGAFLVTVGHLLILVPHVPTNRHVAFWAWGFITDAIGLAAILGPWIVPRLDARRRCAMAGLLYGVSWFAAVGWHPQGAWRAARDLWCGPFGDPSAWGYVFPLLPWLSVYLVGTVLGERIAAWREHAGDSAVAKRLAIMGGALVILALAAWLPLRHGALLAPPVSYAPLLHAMTSPFHKLPPGPTYLALQGGLGLLLVASLAWLQGRPGTRLLFAASTRVGRASLVVFVVQYYVFFGIPAVGGLSYTPFWPLLFVLALALIFLVAWLWDRKAANSLLTVGLEPRLRPAADPGRRPVPAGP